jgi:hypothetical protein
MAWRMKGDYFENCNCDVHCPCTASGLQARPTNGHCDVVFAVHIEQGNYDDVSLDGLNWILALTTPAEMHKGNATAALYIDQRASAEQAQALATIASGQAGGIPKLVGELIPITNFLGVKQVPIEFHKDGLTRTVVAQGIADIAIEAYRGADGEGPVTIGNVQHPFAQNHTLTLGMATRSTFKDYEFSWDNTGKNAHYSAFEWSTR